MAAAAVGLLLHAQAVWACAGMMDMTAALPCCMEHAAHGSLLSSDCNDNPAGKALCAKPYAHTAVLAVTCAANNAADDQSDTGSSHGMPVIAGIRDMAIPDIRLLSHPPDWNPDRVLAPGRLTYLKTLRLRL